MRSTGQRIVIGVGAWVVLTALLLGGWVTTAAASEASSSAAANSIELANAERRERGIPALRVSAELNRVATAWSHEMARLGLLHHNPNLAGQVGSASWRAENVGHHPSPGSVDAGVRSIHDLFMRSPGHRANVLETRVGEIGVGVVRAEDGSVWVTQVFRGTSGGSGGTSAPAPSEPKPSEPAPTQPAPSEPAPSQPAPSSPPSSNTPPSAPSGPTGNTPDAPTPADDHEQAAEQPVEPDPTPTERAVNAPRLDPETVVDLKVTAAGEPVGDAAIDEVAVLSGQEGPWSAPLGGLPGEHPWMLVLSLVLLTASTTATVTVSRRR